MFFKPIVVDLIFIIGNVPYLDEENEMTELGQRMTDAMVLRGLAERTRELYLSRCFWMVSKISSDKLKT